MKQQSIKVTQVFNPSYNGGGPKDRVTNPEHSYRVEQTVNTMTVAIGQYLNPDRLQGLIDSGIDVTIVPVK